MLNITNVVRMKRPTLQTGHVTNTSNQVGLLAIGRRLLQSTAGWGIGLGLGFILLQNNILHAQITIPFPNFQPGQTIVSSQINANNSTLASNACNRASCVLTGALQGTSATFSSTFAVTGAVTLSSTLSVSGATTLAALSSGAITAAGNVAPSTGATYNSGASAARWLTTFTGALDASGDLLDSTGNVTINDAVDVSGAVALSSTLAVTGAVSLSSNLTIASGLTANHNADLNAAHTLNNTNAGAATQVTLNFTNNVGTTVLGFTGGGFTPASDFYIFNSVASGTIRIVMNGGTTTFSGGRVNTNTSQPGFLAYNSASDNSVANGSTVDFDTEVYDHASSFAADTFTAPATGTYLLCMTGGTGGAGTGQFTIVTSNRSYIISNFLTGGSDVSGCVLADMDASDTALVQVGTSGTVNVIGSNSPHFTFFSGRLML